MLRFPSAIKTLRNDQVFSSWVYVIKKAPIINCSRSSMSLKGIFFSFEIRNLRFFKKVTVFFMFLCLLAFITLFQSLIGYASHYRSVALEIS